MWSCVKCTSIGANCSSQHIAISIARRLARSTCEISGTASNESGFLIVLFNIVARCCNTDVRQVFFLGGGGGYI